MNGRPSLVGGVEAGGTKFVCALGTGPDDVRASTIISTTAPAETLTRVIDFFVAQRSAGNTPAALGVASFGPLDLREASPTYGYVTTTLKPGWAGTDLLGPLRDALAVPVALDTDVNGAAVGEARYGATAGLGTAVYVTVGTGIGGGVVVDGRPLRGLMHPEMGHLHVTRHTGDDYPGNCPFHRDCLEGLASGAAILARTGRGAGDLGPHRARVVEFEAWYLAQLISTLIYVISPQRVVLGGGVLKLPGLLEAVRARTVELVAGSLPPSTLPGGIGDFVVRPRLGDLSGVIGALALAQRLAHRSVRGDP